MPALAAETQARSWRPLRTLLALTLVLITLQGSTGGYVAGAGGFTAAIGLPIGGILSALSGASPPVIWHAFEGILVTILAAATAALSLRYPKRGVKAFALLGLIATLIAAAGGYLVVSTGPGPADALMSNGFIGTYAFFFMTLYSTK
jgi:hypothetical protein